jgi:hypothetical protein
MGEAPPQGSGILVGAFTVFPFRPEWRRRLLYKFVVQLNTIFPVMLHFSA